MGLKDDITTGPIDSARGTLIYGPQGIGKSTWGSRAAKPIFLTFEKGSDDLDVTRTKLITTAEKMLEYIDEILADKEYKTVVFDGIDGMAPLIETKVVDHFNKHDPKAEAMPYKHYDDIGYGRNHNEAARIWHNILKHRIEKLKEAGIEVVLLGHSRIVKFDPPDTEAYDKYTLRVVDKVAYQIMAWCDEVLFCNYQVNTRKNGRKHEAIGKGERIIFAHPRPQYSAKTRLKLPPEFPLAYSNYAELRKGAK